MSAPVVTSEATVPADPVPDSAAGYAVVLRVPLRSATRTSAHSFACGLVMGAAAMTATVFGIGYVCSGRPEPWAYWSIVTACVVTAAVAFVAHMARVWSLIWHESSL